VSKKIPIKQSANVVENAFYSIKGRINTINGIKEGDKTDMLQFMEIAEVHLSRLIEFIDKNSGKDS